MVKKLRDIKTIIDIDDISVYLFVTLCVAVVLILIFLTVAVYRFLKRKKEINRKKLYLSRLKSVDLTDPKKAAYDITKYARRVADLEKSKELAKELIEELEKHKYKKNSPRFDDELIKKYNFFLKMCDE